MTDQKFHLTVAAIIKHEDKFLLVTDKTHIGLKLNQPAGHVENNEDIIEAVKREVKEETSLDFTPQYIVGIYLTKLNEDNTYLRICFSGDASGSLENPKPNTGETDVVAAKWYTINEIRNADNLRTPIVFTCLDDFIKGNNFPLEILAKYTNYSHEV